MKILDNSTWFDILDIANKKLYIDKTTSLVKLIYNLCKKPSKAYVIHAPRRFDKTFLMSQLADLMLRSLWFSQTVYANFKLAIF